MPAKTHEIIWTSDRIASFWNRLGSDETLADLYFSKQKGAALLKFTARHIRLTGKVVDLGCGPGYLIDHLLSHGIECEGADFSKDSVHALNQRLSGNMLFQGAKICDTVTDVPFPVGTVDTCFFLEALEHLLPETRDIYLANIARALAPKGRLVMTMPCAENLEVEKVECPACGCRFHRMQHVAAFNPASLHALMSNAGFTTIVCRPVLLLPDWRVYFSGLCAETGLKLNFCPECGEAFKVSQWLLRRIVNKVLYGRLARLVYVGEKSG